MSHRQRLVELSAAASLVVRQAEQHGLDCEDRTELALRELKATELEGSGLDAPGRGILRRAATIVAEVREILATPPHEPVQTWLGLLASQLSPISDPDALRDTTVMPVLFQRPKNP